MTISAGTATAPAAPASLSARLGSAKNKVRLVWTNSSTDEASFRIERHEVGGTWAAVGTRPADQTDYEDTLPSDYTGKTYGPI